MVDRILPPDSISVFPVQYFTQRELPEASALRAARGTSGTIYFRNSFGNARRALDGTTPHRAIDIFAPRGLPVFAATAGRVPRTWTVYVEVTPGHRRPVSRPGIGTPANPLNGKGGNYAIMIDATGRHHYYAHMNETPLVSVGQMVEAGHLLGYVGNTGRDARHTPPHLHYQVTTRPSATVRTRLTYWNAYDELIRLIAPLGGQIRRVNGRRAMDLTFDEFLAAVQGRLGTALIDPWSQTVRPELINPWDQAF